MSEINSIAQGTYTLGQTSATTFEAGPGISITQPSEGTVRISNDETVLFETTANVSTATLSENTSAFDRVNFYIVDDNRGYAMCTLPSCLPGAWKCGNYLPFGDNPANFGDYSRLVYVYTDKNNGGMNWSANGIQKINGTAYNNIGDGFVFIKKVVGINRISGSNT